MKNAYEVIVVGAGTMGMAAGYYLARQKRKVLLLDAFSPPHTYGSHHGDTRINRHAYSMAAQYVPMALRAQQLWDELAEESGQQIFLPTGVLRFGPADSAFLGRQLEMAGRFHIPVETLTADEINRRWPGFRLPGNMGGNFEPRAGVLKCTEAIQAFRALASGAGAVIRDNEPVRQIEIQQDHVVVHSDQARYHADKVIVSAGAWTKQLLSFLPIPVKIMRKTVGWFQAPEPLYQSEQFPAFIGEDENGVFYGFPCIARCGVKVGRHDGGQESDPDQLNRTFGAFPEDEGELRQFLRSYLPQAEGALRNGSVCLYTMTPDEDFIIDHHPEHRHVLIATGFSGHGFKFSSVVGEILSDLITANQTEFDLSPFGLHRFLPNRSE